MAINWYPGHMHKASKEMAEALHQVDLIIELLDARIPYSSQNPKIAKLAGIKPCIKLLSKSDLADPELTKVWQNYYEQQQHTRTLAINSQMPDRSELIFQLCDKLLSGKGVSAAGTVAMITGIPNVGKSTLINTLAGRSVAKTGNEPAVTKGQQRIKLNNGITLLDTPGILWPKFRNQHSAYRLAITGTIKDTAINHEDIADYLIEFLLRHHSDALQQRFDLEEGFQHLHHQQVLELIAAERGCIKAGHRTDFAKVSSLLIHEYRSGQLGRITLEQPQQISAEEAEADAQEQRKKEQKEARKQRHKKNR